VFPSVATEQLAAILLSVLVITLCLAAAQIEILVAPKARFERALASSERPHRAIAKSEFRNGSCFGA
jgi:hypothetical protein